MKNINKGEARGGGRLKRERELISFLPLKGRGGGGQGAPKIFLSTCPSDKHYIKFGCPKPIRVLVQKVVLKTKKKMAVEWQSFKGIFNCILTSMRFAFKTIR